MGYLAADRVKETSTTTGTGTYSLAGAVTGFRTFVAGLGSGNRCTYCVEDGTNWEINEGVITDATPDTLTRAKFLASSTGSAINWGAGTRNVYCVAAAADRNPKTVRLATPHTLASATGTEVTGLQFTSVQPGVYAVQYWLLCQSSLAGTGVGIGLNFTGTAANPTITMRCPTTGTTAATGVYDGTTNVGTGTLVEGRATLSYSTTSPNMLNTGGFATANEDVLVIVEALIVVTAAGDLEVWHSSETANNTTISDDSCGILTRIDD